MEIMMVIWVLVQALVGYNLVFPALLFFLHPLLKRRRRPSVDTVEFDYAIVVTAYQFTDSLPAVVESILNVRYTKYLIYVVADNCDMTGLSFDDERVVLLQPPVVLASNTKSHNYAISNFLRPHDIVTIIDSDNIVDPNYLIELNLSFNQGYAAVQGLRAAKNLDGTIACLDAARDIYYHFYDGKLLFECGSSATLAGSGMAFKANLYKEFLEKHDVTGAGFDKVLQAWLLKSNHVIAFNGNAIVLDEKTSRTDQLVMQRSRWINTWFKYFILGFDILWLGVKHFNRNKFLFGAVLLRPPLFIFLILSVVFLVVNILIGLYGHALVWGIGLFVFVAFFLIALISSPTDKRIYKSLIIIPKFIFYQIVSLTKAKRANKISVATRHYHNTNTEVKDE